MVTLALQFYFLGAFRYRAVGRVLSIAAATLYGLTGPYFTTVRMWILRLGLYRLQSVSLGPRWAMICDHTATYGGLKLLVICGVDLDKLDRRVADLTGNFNLNHVDLQPLAVVPMKQSSGELLLEIYLGCLEKYGSPEQMTTDGGSDILKSARLLAAHQESRGDPPTKHHYDISHRIARIVKAELEPNLLWQQFEKVVTRARIYCTYRARHLSPPGLRHGPDRWMNLRGIVRWFADVKDKVESLGNDTSSMVRSTEAGTTPQVPRFGLTQQVWERAKNTYHQCGGSIFNRLRKLCGKEYTDEQSYEKALHENCPSLPDEIAGNLTAHHDLNHRYLEEVSAESEGCWEIHKEVTQMLAFTDAIQKQVKGAGLTKSGIKICQDIYDRSNLTGVAEQVGKKVMKVIREMGQKLGEHERILVTSDVIESLNGKWKMLINGAAMPALGVNALLMPAIMGELSPEYVKEALEAVSVADVEQWKKETFGITFMQEKRIKTKRIRPENPQEIIF